VFHPSRRTACIHPPAAGAVALLVARLGRHRGLAKDEKPAALPFPKPAVWRAPAWARATALLAWAAVWGAPVHAADPQRGAELYRTHCIACHGSGGKPVLPGAPDFARPLALLKSDTVLLASIRQGRGAMPGYAGQLRDREILDLVAHLRTFR
jgi:cytochrome c6